MAAPFYDNETYLTPLLAIRDAWIRKMESENLPNGDTELTKINKQIKSRLRPNRQSAYTNSTATSRLLSIEKRFVRHRDRRAFNFSKSDAKYLAKVRKILKNRRTGTPAPRAGSKTKAQKSRDRLLASLNERRPPITKESTLEEMEQVRIELLQKKRQFPKHFGQDEREYLKRVNGRIGGLRRAKTTSEMRARIEKLKSTTSKTKYERLHTKQPATGMTVDQERRLTELYYGDGDNLQPTPMGVPTLYSFLKDEKGLPAPSAPSIQKWLNNQKLNQVYAPRRLEHQGDVASFKPTVPLTGGLSMDLASYLFGKKEITHRQDHKDGKVNERFSTKMGAPGYVLGVCDNFSRYLWTRPISDKKPQTVAKALASIIAEIRQGNDELDPLKAPISYVQCDDGNEFKGVVSLLLKQGGKFGAIDKDSSKTFLYTTTEENETPRQISKIFNTPVDLILKLNDWTELEDQEKRTVLTPSSKFQKGTEINIPSSTLKPIRMVRTVGGAPQSNALIERIFGTLKRIISKTYSIKGGSWRTILPNATWTYNEHHHAALNGSPVNAILADTKPAQKQIRANIYHAQNQDHTEIKPALREGERVRLRILAPTFNRGSRQSYYATVFTIKNVIKSTNPTRSVRYELEGPNGGGNAKLLAKSYTRKHLLPISEVENEDRLIKNPLFKSG